MLSPSAKVVVMVIVVVVVVIVVVIVIVIVVVVRGFHISHLLKVRFKVLRSPPPSTLFKSVSFGALVDEYKCSTSTLLIIDAVHDAQYDSRL